MLINFITKFCYMLSEPMKKNQDCQYQQKSFTLISLLEHPTNRTPCTHSIAVMTESQTIDPTSITSIPGSPPVISYNITSIHSCQIKSYGVPYTKPKFLTATDNPTTTILIS